jgi:hypothetical protein
MGSIVLCLKYSFTTKKWPFTTFLLILSASFLLLTGSVNIQLKIVIDKISNTWDIRKVTQIIMSIV